MICCYLRNLLPHPWSTTISVICHHHYLHDMPSPPWSAATTSVICHYLCDLPPPYSLWSWYLVLNNGFLKSLASMTSNVVLCWCLFGPPNIYWQWMILWFHTTIAAATTTILPLSSFYRFHHSTPFTLLLPPPPFYHLQHSTAFITLPLPFHRFYHSIASLLYCCHHHSTVTTTIPPPVIIYRLHHS